VSGVCSLTEKIVLIDEPKVILSVVDKFQDLIKLSENVILYTENKKYRYYYDIVMGHNFLFYFVFYVKKKTKKVANYVALGTKEEILESEYPKVGYRPVIHVKWDSLISRIFEEYLK